MGITLTLEEPPTHLELIKPVWQDSNGQNKVTIGLMNGRRLLDTVVLPVDEFGNVASVTYSVGLPAPNGAIPTTEFTVFVAAAEIKDAIHDNWFIKLLKRVGFFRD